MAKLKVGDPVKVTAREQTAQDIKSGLYYPHYANLTGTILKVYGEEASVKVDRDSLPEDVRLRHDEGEKAMRQKWADSLSEEARGRLGEAQKSFNLEYAVLVSLSDLAPYRPTKKELAAAAAEPAPRPSAEAKRVAKEIGQSARAIDMRTGESDVSRATRRAEQPGENGTESSTRRLSLTDLEAREEEFLRQRAKDKKGGDGGAS